MTDQEIQEQAEKILQEYKGDGCYIHEDDAIGAMNDLAQWMQERENNNAINLLEAEVIRLKNLNSAKDDRVKENIEWIILGVQKAIDILSPKD